MMHSGNNIERPKIPVSPTRFDKTVVKLERPAVAAFDIATAPPEPIVDTSVLQYAAELGFAPEELSERDWYCIHAAKKLAPQLDDIHLPVATLARPSGEMVRVEKKVKKTIEQTEYRDSFRPSDHPTDTFEVVPVENIEDLRSLLPTQWLMESVAPEQFYRSLVNRDLLRREWQENDKQPFKAERVVEKTELVWEPAPPTIERPHAYVLMDASGSMDADDGRGIAAAGLALAFLKKAFDQRARMHASTFSHDANALVSGESLQDLKNIARHLMNPEEGGGTDIQKSLQSAVRRIEKHKTDTPADILLITDGESELDKNPLGKIKLHVLLVGNDFSEDSISESHKRLKSWSKTFKRITERFDAIPLQHTDVVAMSRATNTTAVPVAGKSLAELEKIFYRLRGLARLLSLTSNRKSDEAKALKKKLDAAQRALVKAIENKKQQEQQRREKAIDDADIDELLKPIEQAKKHPVQNAPSPKTESNALGSLKMSTTTGSALDLTEEKQTESWLERIAEWLRKKF